MHICSSWLYTWLPTSISRPARDKGKQISYQLIPKYIFFFKYYFLVLIILLSLFSDIFLLKRVADPIQNQPIVRLQFSSLGLVPKKDGDLRLIHHISYPEGHSISILLIQGPVLFITQALMRQQA